MAPGPDRWATVERLYHEALTRPVGGRSAFLAGACAGDDALRHEVESLLAHNVSADDALGRGAVAAAAGLMSDVGPSALTGRRIGAYHVLAQIGAGGMGEVYRARDTRLGRDVAIKILPREFTSHPDRLARFQREARVLATLNHPHIGAIYGIEDEPCEAGPHIHALVLELIEGETLAERIARRKGAGLPINEALDIARQIADALDAAHEKGIVHRDLKPANIKITPEGVVKVLDFGLAKLDPRRSDNETESPTITAGDTHEGLIIGTAAYMSPDQARGLAVDKRTDIWAFGCVLYEMLTGHAAFPGKTISDTIAAILEREPDWAAMPAAVPGSVQLLIRHCLEKDPKRRLRDIGDTQRDVAVSEARDLPSRTRPAVMVSALVVFIVLAAGLSAVAWRWLQPAASNPASTQFTFAAPPGALLEPAAVPSPDGSRIVFVARAESGASTLWLRRRDSTAPQQIAGTEGATGPSWSPDDRFIAFQSGRKLKKVDPSDGGVLTIASMGTNLGATWNTGNTVVFAPQNRTSLYRVSSDGGAPEAITTLATSRRENSHRWPAFLPDGQHYLFTARSDVKENTAIYVGSLDSKTTTRLLTAQSNAVYAPPGYLLFAREGTLMAQKFDASTLTLSGDAFRVAAGVEHIPGNAQALFAVSADGSVLTYQSALGRSSRLEWFDREGHSLGPVGPEKDFTTDLQIAPNGKQALVVIPDLDSGNRDLWLVDLRTGGLTRLTSHPANDWQAAWEPDSNHVVFASDRNGTSNVYRKATNGAGEDEPIIRMSRNTFPKDSSIDGRFLLFIMDDGSGGTDLWAAPRIGGGKPYPFIVSAFNENHSAFSPDGRWVTYESDESGANEIYLKPFAGAGKQQVSRGGGLAPRWKRDGTELCYVNPSNELMRVAVSGSDTIETSAPTVLFKTCRRGDPNPLYQGTSPPLCHAARPARTRPSR